MTLRGRVTYALVAIVALFVCVQGTLAYLSLEEQEDELADELVLVEARRLAARAERGDLRGDRAADLLALSPNLTAWLVDASGRAIPGPVPSHLASLSDGPHRPRGRGVDLHVVVLPTVAGRLFIQYDAWQSEAQVRQFAYYMAALGALCIGLCAAVAWRVSAIVVAPIERLTALLTGWAPGAPPVEKGASGEESRLLGAFRRVQDRFEQAIAREREFIANMRHEIRTPLAALRTDLEMLELAAGPGSAQQERVKRVLASVDAISGSLESASALSFRERTGAEPVDLARCVDDAWASLAAFSEIGDMRFVNEVPPGTLVTADRHALLTILRNLIRNAAEHAAPGYCAVRATVRGVEVVDNGPGIAAEELPFVFDRYYRGRLADSPDSSGAAARADRGLGLAIARQIADLQGWKLTVASEIGRGTRFVLDLDEV